MTDKQPHTPLTDTVREVYSFAGAQAPSVRKQWFDRWLATVETAAEQRGAIKALRDAADAIEKNQIITQLGHLQPCNSCMAIHMDFLDYRADRIANKEEGE